MIRINSPPRQVAKSHVVYPSALYIDHLFNADINVSSVTTETKTIPKCKPMQSLSCGSTFKVEDLCYHKTPKSRSNKERSISFGKVSVRTHSLTLGDNPAVTSGLPLALEWDHDDSECFDVDEYEKINEGRQKIVIKMPQEFREALLKRKGHSDSALDRASRDVERIKAARHASNEAIRKKKAQMEEYMILSNVSLRPLRRGTSSHDRIKKDKVGDEEVGAISGEQTHGRDRDFAPTPVRRRPSILGLRGQLREDNDSSTVRGTECAPPSAIPSIGNQESEWDQASLEAIQGQGATSPTKQKMRKRWSLLARRRSQEFGDSSEKTDSDAKPALRKSVSFMGNLNLNRDELNLPNQALSQMIAIEEIDFQEKGRRSCSNTTTVEDNIQHESPADDGRSSRRDTLKPTSVENGQGSTQVSFQGNVKDLLEMGEEAKEDEFARDPQQTKALKEVLEQFMEFKPIPLKRKESLMRAHSSRSRPFGLEFRAGSMLDLSAMQRGRPCQEKEMESNFEAASKNLTCALEQPVRETSSNLARRNDWHLENSNSHSSRSRPFGLEFRAGSMLDLSAMQRGRQCQEKEMENNLKTDSKNLTCALEQPVRKNSSNLARRNDLHLENSIDCSNTERQVDNESSSDDLRGHTTKGSDIAPISMGRFENQFAEGRSSDMMPRFKRQTSDSTRPPSRASLETQEDPENSHRTETETETNATNEMIPLKPADFRQSFGRSKEKAWRNWSFLNSWSLQEGVTSPKKGSVTNSVVRSDEVNSSRTSSSSSVKRDQQPKPVQRKSSCGNLKHSEMDNLENTSKTLERSPSKSSDVPIFLMDI